MSIDCDMVQLVSQRARTHPQRINICILHYHHNEFIASASNFDLTGSHFETT